MAHYLPARGAGVGVKAEISKKASHDLDMVRRLSEVLCQLLVKIFVLGTLQSGLVYLHSPQLGFQRLEQQFGHLSVFHMVLSGPLAGTR
jgi:hypothetical protein